MPATWLHHRAIQARYGYSRNTIDRLHGEGKLPPPCRPTGHAPMWPLDLLDFWDSAQPHERETILTAWPHWREAVAVVERDRAAVASEKPQQRRKRKAAA